MTTLFASLLAVSFVINCILIWYVRKLVQNMSYAIYNVDEMQKMLNEYAVLLQPLATMENYYNDPALTSAINNTLLVVDACKVFKKTMIVSGDEENQEQETKENSQTDDKEQKAPFRGATIGSVGS